MSHSVSRRHFLTTGAAVLVPAFGATDGPSVGAPRQPAVASLPALSFPTQDPALVREMVAVSHGNVARVKELVNRQPTLARAAYDWGFGDWEDALGAASHVGNRDIAEYLIGHGARPTIFSAAMLGQLDAVMGFVAASPGVQRLHGPHGITLLAHARAGGASAAPVVAYLEGLGDADQRIVSEPLSAEALAALTGTYAFGAGATERIEITLDKAAPMFARAGGVPRGLAHRGGLSFSPAGAPEVRIRFVLEKGRGATLTVHDPDVIVTARRVGE
jgi:hypothetical protein